MSPHYWLAHLSMSVEYKDVGKQIMNLRDNEIPKPVLDKTSLSSLFID